MAGIKNEPIFLRNPNRFLSRSTKVESRLIHPRIFKTLDNLNL